MRWSLAIAGALLTLSFCGSAAATSIPGPNGKIVFASGRASSGIPSPSASDADARIWVADYPGGTPVQVTTLPAGMQHRHPNWSPDHTRIVYAAGTAFSATRHYALWIVDLRTGSQTEFVPAADGQDRPTWSPDGTEIAYGSGGNLFEKNVTTGIVTQLTNENAGDERPVWSPDGNTLYFNRGAPGSKDLYKLTPVALGGATFVAGSPGIDDWQPAVSPDGTRLCYTKGPQSDGADLYTVNVANPLSAVAFSAEPMVGELNCVWSPDGTHVLYTRGAFGAGDLYTSAADGSNQQKLTSMDVDAHFDGNADWATNFPATCDAKNASVNRNAFTTILLSCADPDFGFGAAAPTSQPLDSDAMEIVAAPQHGNIGSISSSESVIYTPAKDFTGTDTFAYRASDGTSDGPPAIVTVHVNAPNGPGGGGTDTTAPVVSKVALSRTRWRRAVGTTIRFAVDEAGTARVAFARATTGRRVGGRCVKATRANRRRGRCTRFVAAGSFTVAARQGANSLAFRGRLSQSKQLALGRYRVAITVTDAAGNTSKPAGGATFRIVQR